MEKSLTLTWFVQYHVSFHELSDKGIRRTFQVPNLKPETIWQGYQIDCSGIPFYITNYATNINLDKQAKQWTQEEILLGVMFGVLLSLWLSDLDTKKFGTEVFEEPGNVVLEENGEDKTVRVSN